MLIRLVWILFPPFSLTPLRYFVGKPLKPDLSRADKLNMDVFVSLLPATVLP